MASTSIKKKNASDIANKFLPNCPNLTKFLQILVMDVDIETKSVGRRFEYPQSVIAHKLFTIYGIVMDNFIRKHLANQFHVNPRDEYAEIILNNVDAFFTDRVKIKISPNEIRRRYVIFKDSKTQAMDILDSIKTVSLSTHVYFKDPLPRVEVETKKENLIEIKKYFEKLPYSEVEIKRNVGCEYFEGNADIIFDKKVLYEIKTSKFRSLSRNDEELKVKNFYKLILYGFGYFKQTGIIIKTFKIYNPLLGLESTIKLNDIDMKHFEEVLKKDIEPLEMLLKRS